MGLGLAPGRSLLLELEGNTGILEEVVLFASVNVPADTVWMVLLCDSSIVKADLLGNECGGRALTTLNLLGPQRQRRHLARQRH